MSRRMPVLGEDDIRKAPRQRVDCGHDFVAAWDREAAARHERVLQVDDQESRRSVTEY